MGNNRITSYFDSEERAPTIAPAAFAALPPFAAPTASNPPTGPSIYQIALAEAQRQQQMRSAGDFYSI